MTETFASCFIVCSPDHKTVTRCDASPFISVSSLTRRQADGALAVKLATNFAPSLVEWKTLVQLALRPFSLLCCVFYAASARARVVVASMQDNDCHRTKKSKGTWTNPPLVLYNCTLYLLIFSLELKGSVTGETLFTSPLNFIHVKAESP